MHAMGPDVRFAYGERVSQSWRRWGELPRLSLMPVTAHLRVQQAQGAAMTSLPRHACVPSAVPETKRGHGASACQVWLRCRIVGISTEHLVNLEHRRQEGQRANTHLG